jgi:two-component system, cell cycle sensor histidine kinase and response regulator CckA
MESENQPVSLMEAARLSLARLGILDPSELDRAMQVAARLSATTLQASRVGIWLFDGFGALRCAAVHALEGEPEAPGGLLRVEDYPHYFAAIRARRAISADDAQRDPRTTELAPYLEAHGIGSLLDVPIYTNGEVAGVVCFEQIGPPRHWAKRDVDFAISIGDMLSSLFEHARLLAAEAAERRAIELAAHAERMDALARLALGVIHDVNNLLTVVSIHAAVLEPRDAARDVIEQCEAAGRLTRQLLLFARGGSSERFSIDAARVIGDFEHVLRSALGPTIELSVSVEGPAMVLASRSDLEQSILNLALNAHQAMGESSGGHIALTVGLDDDHVVVTVRDDGDGMDAATQRRAFEPFFTTREATGGTGMGLATVYGILKRAGGDIQLDSARGRGTTIALRFPHAPSGRTSSVSTPPNPVADGITRG